MYTLLPNSEFMWVGVYLFIPSTPAPSLTHNICFEMFKLNFFPTFLPLSLMGMFSVIFNTISLGNHLVYRTALAKANCDPNAQIHHAAPHFLPGNNLNGGCNSSAQCPLDS